MDGSDFRQLRFGKETLPFIYRGFIALASGLLFIDSHMPERLAAIIPAYILIWILFGV